MLFCGNSKADAIQNGNFRSRRIGERDILELEAAFCRCDAKACGAGSIDQGLAIKIFAKFLKRGNSSDKKVEEGSDLTEKQRSYEVC